MTKKILILGAVGNCIDILDTIIDINNTMTSPRFQCMGFLDDDQEKWGKIIFGIPVLGGLDIYRDFDDAYFINGIGNSSNFMLKDKIIDRINAPPERFQTIVHPSASISQNARIGSGVVIFQNVTVTTNVTIQNHVMVLPNAVISHDCTVGDYTIIAGGVVVNGNVTIGKSCYLGANCSIRQDINIGSKSLIGMGSVVIRDVKEKSVIAGNPAKFLGSSV